MKNINQLILGELHKGVRPALGCTEPVAVALAVATASKRLEGEIEQIQVFTSPNIYKNGMGVGIPGTDMVGLDYSTALGAICGDPNLGLEVLEPVNNEYVEESKELLEEGKVSVSTEEREENFYIDTVVKKSTGLVRVIIQDTHTNIVYIEENGVIVLDDRKNKKSTESSNSDEFLRDLDIKDLIEFAETVDFKDIEFLLEGVKVNRKIAEYGLEHRSGSGIGAGMESLMERGLLCGGVMNKAKVLAAAASDARMAGVKLPVMSSGGSGNQGITAILPVYVMWKELKDNDEESLARALGISHSVTAFVKSYLGNLASTCGCAIAAGIGAAAAIVWLMGGTLEQIEIAIKNIIGSLSGMVCDGAKGGCAFKISTATQEAIIQAYLAMDNVAISDRDGILAPTAKQSIINLSKFSKVGMKDADKTIIDIMVDNQKSWI